MSKKKGLQRERQSDQREQEVRGVKRVEKTRKKVREDADIGTVRQEEREREQEKAQVRRRKFSKEQRENKIQGLENRLKRGLQQIEANYKGSMEEEEVSRVLSGLSLTLRLRKIQTLFYQNVRIPQVIYCPIVWNV